MAVWSVIKTSRLGGAFRLDAEYWRPEYLAAERRIKSKPHVALGSIATIRKGVFNILADSYVESGVPFYRSSNVGEIIPKTTSTVFITPDRHREESKTALRRGDIMLAKTGNPAASVILEQECNVSQDVIAVKPDRAKINPFYAAVFLNTRDGVLQMRRWFQGQVQMHLSLPDAKMILIPLASDKVQIEAERLVMEAESRMRDAEAAMARAEAILLDWLGLRGRRQHHKIFYSRPLSSLLSAGRFDAEFFSPRLQQAVETLSKFPTMIGDVAPLSSRRFKPKAGERFGYIEIGGLSPDGQANAEQVEGGEAASRATSVVKAGDVITSTVRPIRRLSAMIRADQNDCVCSSGFAVLSPKMMEPEVLLAYLRLPILCELMDLHTTATMYPAIPVDKLLRLPCPIPPPAVREKIVQNVQAGIKARLDGAQAIAKAKEKVELAKA